MSYFLDELKPGMSESLTHVVSERMIAAFGEATGDMNPVHFDEAYAKGTVFNGRIAHGLLAAGFMSAVMGTKIPGTGTIVQSLSTRFRAAVRIGDTVVTTCTVRKIVKQSVIFDCVCKVGDTVVVQGEAIVLAPIRPV